MQREIGENVHLRQNVSAFDSIGGVSSIQRKSKKTEKTCRQG